MKSEWIIYLQSDSKVIQGSIPEIFMYILNYDASNAIILCALGVGLGLLTDTELDFLDGRLSGGCACTTRGKRGQKEHYISDFKHWCNPSFTQVWMGACDLSVMCFCIYGIMMEGIHPSIHMHSKQNASVHAHTCTNVHTLMCTNVHTLMCSVTDK